MNTHNLKNNEADRWREVLGLARLAWWEADLDRQIYHCSDFVVDLLSLPSKEISFSDLFNMVRNDYRDLITTNFRLENKEDICEQRYPLITSNGTVWVHSKWGKKKTDENGKHYITGIFTQFFPEEDKNIPSQAQCRLDTMLGKQRVITNALLSFIKNDNVEEVTNTILNEILWLFNGDRTYIFEFNEDHTIQNCTYEIIRKGIRAEKDFLQNLPTKDFGWFTEQVLKGIPITLNNLNQIPQKAFSVKVFLEKQNIKSLMIMPLYSKDCVWGYVGVDIVKNKREWSNDDRQWFSSLANILSICILLRRSEEKAVMGQNYIYNLYKHMPVAYLRLKVLENGNYLIQDLNTACEKIMEWNYNTHTGYTTHEAGLDLDKMLPDLKDVIGTDKSYQATIQLESEKVLHLVINSPRKDEVVIMFSDITDTFKTHEALERNEAILRNIHTNLPVGLELYDNNGYLIELNDKELEMFGLSDKKHVLGINFFENPLVPKDIKECLKKGNPVNFSFEYKFNQLNGYYSSSKQNESIHLSVKGTPLYDSSGKLLQYLFINIDNTEIYNARDKIKEFEDFFSFIGNYAQVGYAHYNALTMEGYAVDSWYKNMGEEPGTPLSKIIGVISHVHPGDQPKIKNFFKHVYTGEVQTLRENLRIIHEDGHITWTCTNVIVRNFCPQKNIIEIVCINFDITELKEMEAHLIEARNKAETSDRLKSAFLANMSHEIRTPLNAIVGFSELVADTNEEDERRRYISIVKENNELLLQLISDILDLSKFEAGMFEFVNDNVDINQMCREIVQTLRLKMTGEVSLNFEKQLPECHLLCDRKRLTQIITNFINNAQKFTQKGHIDLGYELTQNNYLRFYVRDTGIGIPPDKLDTIFVRFVKLNNFIQGTGLGLSICKSMVEQMGGSIGADSTEGLGSTFWFTIPFIPFKFKQNIINTKTIRDMEQNHTNKAKILVAEDVDSNYLLVSTLLRKEYDLKRAYNGKEAIELHKDYQPDLILMDMKMPEMDGLSATSHIRETDKTTPIIALTAFAFDKDREQAIEAGCNDYLSKPLSGNELKETLKKWLQTNG